MTSFLGSITFLEQLTEIRETFYLLDHWFIMKGYNSETARSKKFTGHGVWQGHGVSLPSPRTQLSQCLHVFTSPAALQIPSFWVFVEGSFKGNDQITGHGLQIQPLPPLPSHGV